MTRSYLVVYEKGAENWSGYFPQVPGCISVGDTLDEMRAMMTEALEAHLGCMAKDGDPIPETTISLVDFAEETPENGVEYCQVEWLTVRISVAFAGTPASEEDPVDETETTADKEIYAGTLRSVFTHAGIKHP